MLLRILIFFAFPWAGGALGWWLAGPWAGAAGASAGALLWWAGEVWNSARVLAWLRAGDLAHTPRLHGLWGEAADRMRRLLRQSQQREQASDARLQEILAALQASPNGVTLLDAQGRIEWCNQMAASHFGLDPARDLLQSIGNLLRDPGFSAYQAAQDYAHDVLLTGRESTPSRPVRIAARLHPYGDGRKLLLSRDVTALEQAEAMRRDFVANVSHEIRTPLTVLAGFIETLQTLPLNAQERARYLALMAQQAARMQHLVQDLLTLSRLEGSPPPGHGAWTSVHSLLQRCEEEARALALMVTPADAPPLHLQFPPADFQRACGEIAGNPAELHSALSNLIGNAVRYTPAGGSITVQWQPLEDGRARFAVRDTGAGIAPEDLPRLTERFYRVDRSRSRDTGGTGLGLAIVKHVLQRHEAVLGIASTPGQGAEFSATFPAHRLRGAAPPALLPPGSPRSLPAD